MINLTVSGCNTIGDSRVISLKSGKNGVFIADNIVAEIHHMTLGNLRQKIEKILDNFKSGKDYLVLEKEDIKNNKIKLRSCGFSNISLDRSSKIYLIGVDVYCSLLDSVKKNTIEMYSSDILDLVFGVEPKKNIEVIEKKDMPATISIEGEFKMGEKVIPKIRGGFGPDQMILSELQISELHNKEVRHIRQAVKRIESKLIQWVDYIDLSCCQDCDTIFEILGYTEKQLQAKHFYIFSERGYLKLVKHFNDDESWRVFEELLDKYFNIIVKEDASANNKANALLLAIEGRTPEERASGLQQYTHLLTSELQNTIDAQQIIIDTIMSDDSLYSIGLVGRVLKSYNPKVFGKIKIFEMMRASGILVESRKSDEHNTPRHRYAKYFEVKMREIDLPNGDRKVVPKTFFTADGLSWFLKRIAKEKLIDKNKINEIKGRITAMNEDIAA